MAIGNEKPEYLCADYKQNEIIFNMEGNVKGGTVIALVQRLTQHDQLGKKKKETVGKKKIGLASIS